MGSSHRLQPLLLQGRVSCKQTACLTLQVSDGLPELHCKQQQQLPWPGLPVCLRHGTATSPCQALALSPALHISAGIGLGCLVSRSTKLRDELFIAAAEALAKMVTDDDRAAGSIYPPIGPIRFALKYLNHAKACSCACIWAWPVSIPLGAWGILQTLGVACAVLIRAKPPCAVLLVC